jgi:hypothetical protein
MKLLGLLIAGVHPKTSQAVILYEEYELSSLSFFIRGEVKKSFKFVVRESI